MFACIRRCRRSVAVLAAVTLLAGVLAAVPVVADEDPEQNYLPTFSACDGAPAAGFEDVPAGHANAGDIDCIAYYGITRGTSATTYSPLMSVTREQMALFLTRLAGVVGIEVTSTPDDAGFADIGDLSDESQTAINQLADLEITQGTSSTSYSPSDSVTRGQMALFVSRLMNLMDPFSDGDTMHGRRPSDVTGSDDKPVMSPFTDLGSATKSAYDAITQLWELGVASGISDTAYAPSASITRAAMADFMAGVLDHSNARPAGISIQASQTSGYGSVPAIVAVSARDDDFMPMADVSIQVFSASDAGGFDDDGKCIMEEECTWSDNEEPTDASGNYFEDETVTTDDGTDAGGAGNVENSDTWYAWMSDDDNDDNDEFVMGSSGESSVTVTAMPNALGIKITTDINENADGHKVNLNDVSTVVITAQLIDTADATDDSANPVAKENVELAIKYVQGSSTLYPSPDAMMTDSAGRVMFTITGPEPVDDNDGQARSDVVTFKGDIDDDDSDESNNIRVEWIEAAPMVTDSMASAPKYAIIDDGEVSILVTVSYYDQYGNPDAQNEMVTITITNGEADQNGEASDERRVRRNGTASFRGNVDAESGHLIGIDVGATDGTSRATENPANVLAVRHAHKNDDGKEGTVTADTDNDRFIIDGVLYSYDSDDVFIIKQIEVDMAAFEEHLDKANSGVNVVFYSVDGTSIFADGGGDPD